MTSSRFAKIRRSEARALALVILNRLNRGQRTLDHELEQTLGRYPALEARERRLLNALVFGVLRFRGRLDWIIAHFAAGGLKKIDPPVLNLLRLGVFQIVYLSRIPDSAAVNTSVALAKTLARPWTVRFVNALLRRVAAEHHLVAWPDPLREPVAALAAGQSFPVWLIKRWLRCFGFEETQALCTALNAVPPITVRINTLKIQPDEAIQPLAQLAEEVTVCRYAPEGISFSSPQIPIERMEPFQNGWFQVQDEAAQLVVHLLDPKPGERVLDACAGLGGKTGHIAQRMKNKGQVLALDYQNSKLLRLQKEMQRLGVDMVQTMCHDLNRPLPVALGIFDRVLLDAPCSGLGVIGRNPDVKWAAAKRDLKRYQRRQAAFLKQVAMLVKPGGILVYAVCSLEPEENEAAVSAFKAACPEFEINAEACCGDDSLKHFVRKDGALAVYPHKTAAGVHMDGFFMAPFVRVNSGKA